MCVCVVEEGCDDAVPAADPHSRMSWLHRISVARKARNASSQPALFLEWDMPETTAAAAASVVGDDDDGGNTTQKKKGKRRDRNRRRDRQQHGCEEQ